MGVTLGKDVKIDDVALPNDDSLTEAQRKQVKEYARRCANTQPAPVFREDGEANGKKAITFAKGAHNLLALLCACGTKDESFAQSLVTALSNTTGFQSDQNALTTVNAGLAAMAGIAPKDEAEAMLATQMVATHHAAMNMLQHARCTTELPSAQWYSGFAVKLMRTFTMQMDALQRYRGHGQQTVRVEHVTVNAGGQAIVGAVTPAGGVGAQQNTEAQPHAKPIECQPLETLPPLRCADTARQAVPVSGNAERKMPHARRKIHRSAKGKPERL